MSSIRVRARKDGSSYTQVMFRLHGKQTSESFDDHREALKWQALLDRVGPEKARLVLNSAQEPQTLMTVEELVVRHIEQLTGLERGTLQKYERYLRNDISPCIGSLPVALFDEEADAQWVNYLAAKGNSRKTIKNKHGFLSSAMKTGMKLSNVPLTHNPCLGRKLPKTGKKQEMVVYTPEQFLSHLRFVPTHWHTLIHFLARFGPRWSEATALMPMDFDRKHKAAHIQRAWKWTGTSETRLGPPKTETSDRHLEFDEESWDMIEPLLFGPDDKFVFTNTVGGPIRIQTFYNNAWKPSIWLANGCESPSQLTHPDFRPPRRVPKAGMWHGIEPAPAHERLGIWPRIHDLRHTCASWLIDAGYDLFAISRLLGHESTDTTTRIYGHLVRGKLRNLASGVSQQLRAAEEGQRGAGRTDTAAA
ncbi:integrase family protein [Segniliparus rotundus DSM 44985]|uniref:Integrase family protein n=1 Tax=Segniliparus rotundus (strain ATCC BAA-972 / CDC 1076 / CIP 108378 / DSM 44985 / JCM 13578) TaxID=640132 RepID=D6Z9C6_SEGRD|nr:site-specific integrase [Segniliparus rotundus]ADG98556.1 integrase family protein [Segniliparus rotundus DSM 44985]